MPISVAEGNLRPNEPVQAAKFASDDGVIIRSQVPTLTHWNQYMEQTEHFDSFMGRLSVSAYVLVLLHSTLFPMAVVQLEFYFWSPGEVSDTSDKATTDACASVLKTAIRQNQYRLKQDYFVGVPANEIFATSPLPTMNDGQWRQFVNM